MILVLCEAFDAAAYWAASGLQNRTGTVMIVTANDLDGAARWEHRVSRTGAATVEVTLADGRVVSSATPAGVLNRLGYVPTDRLDRLGSPDRDYAMQEMNALYLSWLHGLPGPMLNRPKPQGLGGMWRHPAAWAMMAGQAGLAIAPYHHSCRTDPAAAWAPPHHASTVTVFAVGGRTIASSPVPPRVRAGCIRLAGLAGEGLLGVDLMEQAGKRWVATGASPRPDLTAGGDALLDALQEALTP